MLGAPSTEISGLQPPQCIVLVSGTVSSRPPVQGMVLLAVPPKHHRALVSRLDLSNKIVIDVSNPSPAKPGWMRLTRRTGRATGPAQAASNSSQRSDTCISAAERLQLMLNLQHNSKLTGVADDASVPAQHRAGSSSGSVGTDGGGVSNSANSAGFPPTVVLSLAPDFVGQLDPGQAAQTSLEPPCPGRLTQAAPPGKTASAAVYNLQPFSKPTPATVVKAFNGLSAIDLGNQVQRGVPLMTSVCGDDSEAVAAVKHMASAMGITANDAGGLQGALHMEAAQSALFPGWGLPSAAVAVAFVVWLVYDIMWYHVLPFNFPGNFHRTPVLSWSQLPLSSMNRVCAMTAATALMFTFLPGYGELSMLLGIIAFSVLTTMTVASIPAVGATLAYREWFVVFTAPDFTHISEYWWVIAADRLSRVL
ncbi:MAG: hypothetical protein WDW38_000602 [Sanguina aurantia]